MSQVRILVCRVFISQFGNVIFFFLIVVYHNTIHKTTFIAIWFSLTTIELSRLISITWRSSSSRLIQGCICYLKCLISLWHFRFPRSKVALQLVVKVCFRWVQLKYWEFYFNPQTIITLQEKYTINIPLDSCSFMMEKQCVLSQLRVELKCLLRHEGHLFSASEQQHYYGQCRMHFSGS